MATHAKIATGRVRINSLPLINRESVIERHDKNRITHFVVFLDCGTVNLPTENNRNRIIIIIINTFRFSNELFCIGFGYPWNVRDPLIMISRSHDLSDGDKILSYGRRRLVSRPIYISMMCKIFGRAGNSRYLELNEKLFFGARKAVRCKSWPFTCQLWENGLRGASTNFKWFDCFEAMLHS